MDYTKKSKKELIHIIECQQKEYAGLKLGIKTLQDDLKAARLQHNGQKLDFCWR